MLRFFNTVLVVLAAVNFLAACSEMRLPSEQEMREVFIAKAGQQLIEPPAPAEIPVLAVSEMKDWQELCDVCHIGPNYSSNTILNWGHLESCTTDMVCTGCHAPEIHLTHVRGDKGQCYTCHMSRDIPISCETCHVPGCRAAYTLHDPQFLANHGAAGSWQEMECNTCHGSNNWCFNCHGIDMPHPEDYDTTHPQLVQDDPEVCANCHGSQSCIRCHKALGLQIVQPLSVAGE